MLKVVLDTNVLVSSIFWGGSSHRIASNVNKGFILYMSDEILEEIKNILPRLKYKLPRARIREIIEKFVYTATFVQPKTKYNVIEHEQDNKFIDCAVEAGADYLVTGDEHLLKVRSFKAVKIVRPAEFLDILQVRKRKIG